MTDAPVKLVVDNKTDAEIAADLRDRTAAALRAVLDVMSEAATGGFVVNFTLGIDQAKRGFIQALKISKEF